MISFGPQAGSTTCMLRAPIQDNNVVFDSLSEAWRPYGHVVQKMTTLFFVSKMTDLHNLLDTLR